jgi:hypothetical protein
MLEWDVDERALGVGKELLAVPELGADLEPAAALVVELCRDRQTAVDVHRPEEANREAGRHRRKTVPCCEKPAGLVERGADKAAVHEAGPGLMLIVKGERRLVARQSLLLGDGQVDSCRVVAAAPARRVVMRRDAVQRMPPRSKCALKKFSEPEVAIAADAEISSASVAAATICANR